MEIMHFEIMSLAQKRYGQIMEPLCQSWQLTRNELDVMLFLANNPGLDRAVDIVERRGIAKSHVSLAVSNLESKGFLERQADSTDRRTVRLRLTAAASEIVAQGREIQQQFFGNLFSGISPQELDLWQSMTRKIHRNITTMAKPLADEAAK